MFYILFIYIIFIKLIFNLPDTNKHINNIDKKDYLTNLKTRCLFYFMNFKEIEKDKKYKVNAFNYMRKKCDDFSNDIVNARIERYNLIYLNTIYIFIYTGMSLFIYRLI